MGGVRGRCVSLFLSLLSDFFQSLLLYHPSFLFLFSFPTFCSRPSEVGEHRMHHIGKQGVKRVKLIRNKSYYKSSTASPMQGLKSSVQMSWNSRLCMIMQLRRRGLLLRRLCKLFYPFSSFLLICFSLYLGFLRMSLFSAQSFLKVWFRILYLAEEMKGVERKKAW